MAHTQESDEMCIGEEVTPKERARARAAMELFMTMTNVHSGVEMMFAVIAQLSEGECKVCRMELVARLYRALLDAMGPAKLEDLQDATAIQRAVNNMFARRGLKGTIMLAVESIDDANDSEAAN